MWTRKTTPRVPAALNRLKQADPTALNWRVWIAPKLMLELQIILPLQAFSPARGQLKKGEISLMRD